MIKVFKTVAAVFSAIMFFSAAGHAFMFNTSAFNVDLNTPDALNMHYLDTHRPTTPGVNVVTEDNADYTFNSERPVGGYWYVGPQYSEGNSNDAEAIYTTADSTYLYLAVIQGMPYDFDLNVIGSGLGDIGLDIDRNGIYEYAVDIDNYTGKGRLMGDCSWSKGYDWSSYLGSPQYVEDYYQVTGGSVITPSDFLFSFSSNVNSHYVMEARIPLASLGLVPANGYSVHWGMGCSNDYITLDVKPVPTPEASSMMLMGSGLLGFVSFGARKLYAKKK